MQKQSNNRWRLLADLPFQGTLCLRIAVYWILSQAGLVLTLLGLASLDGTGDSILARLLELLPMALIVSCCLLPIALLDCIVFSNRFSGPLLNFRRKFEKLVNGEPTEAINFRGGDKYRDLETNYNKLRQQMRLQKEIQSANTAASPETATDKELATSR